VVCFDNASHEYFAGTAFAVPAMRNVSFRLAAPSGRGVTLALIGTSGSGKSTLLKHSNALLFPAKGRVAVLGKDTLDKKTRLTGLRMNAVLSAQSPESALFEEFVADDVAFGPANAGLAGEALKARVRAAMEETALPFAEFADRKTRSLSGGEKRLAAVAGAAAMDSPLLLLDEPLAALDGAHQKKITALIQSRRERGKTVIAAIHSMETAASFDLIGVMVDGTLAAFGPPEEIFGPLWNPAWGLELPWTAAVARRLADAGALSGGAAPLDAEELLYCIENGAAPERSAARRHADAAAAGRDCADTPPDRRRTNRRRTTAPGFFRAAPYRFQDRPSPLRSLSGGVKLALLLAGMAAAVALPAFPLPGLSPLESAPLPVFPAALLLLTLAAGAAAGGTGPAHLLRGLCPLAPWLLVIIVLQCLYGGADDSSRVLLSVWKAPVTVDKLVHAVSVVVRAASLIALFTLYSAVTPLRDTLNAFRAGAALLAPSKETARDISMAAGIALRFIPVLTEEAERIVTAQLSRGGKKGRLRMIFSMIVPLFLRALERAEKLAHAMTLRLYGTLRPSA
jgi:energy-coupling factor transporter ATP-binding protein EcfA2/energy-coupling factor transporter transmembrane protein EcfT